MIPSLQNSSGVQTIVAPNAEELLTDLQHYLETKAYGQAFDKIEHSILQDDLNSTFLQNLVPFIESLLPHLSLSDQEKIIFKTCERLRHFPDLKQEQISFLKKTGEHFVIKEPHNLEPAFRYYATACALSPYDPNIHFRLSHLFFDVALEGFYYQLSRSGVLGDTQQFENLINNIPNFHQKFSSTPSQIQLFYKKARQAYREQNDPFKKRVPSHLLKNLDDGEKSAVSLNDAKPFTAIYREKLDHVRTLFQRTPSNSEETLTAQGERAAAFRGLYKALIDDIFFILGDPPCHYDIRAIGSLAREELCPFSDLEYFILVENPNNSIDARYFERFTKIFELQILSLGEVEPTEDKYNFGQKQGLKIDPTGNPSIEKELLTTPAKLFAAPEGEDPNDLKAYRSHLRSVSLCANHRFDLSLPDVKKLSLQFLQMRQAEFSKISILDGNVCHVKKEFYEPLFHFLGDLGLYFGIEENNTLDLIDELPCFDPASKKLLKSVAAHIYNIRCRLHREQGAYQEAASLNFHSTLPRLDPHEITILNTISECVLKPLYRAPLEHFDEGVDLLVDLELKLRQMLSTKELRTRESMRVFCEEISPLGLPNEVYIKYYQILSDHLDPIEPLRALFLQACPERLVSQLEKVPNPYGKRLIYKRRRDTFFENFSKLFSGERVLGKNNRFSVFVSSPFCQGGYLSPDVIDTIFDSNGNIKKEIPGTNSRVSRFIQGPLDFHFKQKPTDPSKESPFHPGREHAVGELMFRLFGRGTSISELFEFVVQSPSETTINRSLALISETVQGTPPDPKNPQPLDPIQLSELFLSLPLLLPGDMRGVNLVATSDGELISIDNDVSWVKPVTKEACNFYTILPFFYRDFVLHPEAIDAFLKLKPVSLLLNWLESLITYNNMILADPHLTAFEQVKDLLFRDPQIYTSTCTFQRGTGGQLYSQFLRLQEFLQKNRHRPIRGVEVLQTIISVDETQITRVGELVYKKYEQAQTHNLDVEDKVKWVTGRKLSQSMSMTQSQATFFDYLPKITEEIKDYSPQLAFVEIEKLTALNFKGFFFQSEGKLASLEKGMEGIDPTTQKYLFKVFVLHTYEHLNLSHSMLTDTDLEVFLSTSGKSLKVLDLRYCPSLTDGAVVLISKYCIVLERLYLSHCKKIQRFVVPQWVGKNLPVQLTKLKILHLSHCDSLTSINIEAPVLQVLKIDNNPRLTKKTLKIPSCKVTSDKSLQLEKAALLLTMQKVQKYIEEFVFGKEKWQHYFGDVGIVPQLPDEIEKILIGRCKIWPDKKVYETHLLVLIPQTVNGQPLNLNTLAKLVQKPLQGRPTKYCYFSLGEYQDTPNPVSHWTLLSRDLIPSSRNKSYIDQQQLVKQYAVYEEPHILDVTVSIFMHYVQTGNRLYPYEPLTYTRCQEKFSSTFQLVVGGFSDGGHCVRGYDTDDERYGIAVQRNFL